MLPAAAILERGGEYACVCMYGWMDVGGGVSRDKGRIGRERIIAVGRVGIGRTYPRRMIVIIISGCRACAQ